MNGAVFIHTRDRLQFLEQTLPKWMPWANETPVYLVVEPDEKRKHEKFLREQGIRGVMDILTLPGKNLGMGASRQVAFEFANDWGMDSFITTDDDLIPVDDPAILLETATMDGVFGVGGYFSMYGLLLKIKPHTGLYKIYNGLGKRIMAFNVPALSAVDGFPVEFKGYDDHEIQRIGVARLGMVWHMDSDMRCHSIAKIGDPGGMTSLPGYARVVDRKHTAHLLTHKNWLGFVSNPEKCDPDSGRCVYTMQWKRFHQHYGVLEG